MYLLGGRERDRRRTHRARSPVEIADPSFYIMEGRKNLFSLLLPAFLSPRSRSLVFSLSSCIPTSSSLSSLSSQPLSLLSLSPSEDLGSALCSPRPSHPSIASLFQAFCGWLMLASCRLSSLSRPERGEGRHRLSPPLLTLPLGAGSLLPLNGRLYFTPFHRRRRDSPPTSLSVPRFSLRLARLVPTTGKKPRAPK